MDLNDPNTDQQALARQNSFWEALRGRLTPTAAQGLLGSGSAQSAAQAMQSRPYMIHVQEARALGQTPMTPQQFMQTQQGLLGM